MFERLIYRAVETSPADPLAAVDPGVLVGPMLIGAVLNTWLFGMQLMQAQTYFRSSPRDPKWIKALVVFLLVANTANSIFDVFFTYDYNVRMFGDKASILRTTWVFNTDPVMTVIISSPVQAFFGWRVQKLTKHTWLAVLIYVSSFFQFLAGLGTSIACGIVTDFANFHSFKSIVIVWLVLAPATDIAISVALVWFLQKSKTGFAVTDDLVARITRLTIQTGAITAIWAIVDLTIFLCFANNLHLIFNMPLSKLYTVCLMSSLNARRQWAGSSYTSGDGQTAGRKGEPRGVHVTTTTGVHQDAYELDPRGIPYDGTAVKLGSSQIRSQPPGRDVKKPPMDDGLSLRSDSITGASDEADDDALGNRDKLADEEAAQQEHQQLQHQARVQIQLEPIPYQQGGHPFAAPASQVPMSARGAKGERNTEWKTAL